MLIDYVWITWLQCFYWLVAVWAHVTTFCILPSFVQGQPPKQRTETYNKQLRQVSKPFPSIIFKYTLKGVEHPEWDQNPWFTPQRETKSISDFLYLFLTHWLLELFAKNAGFLDILVVLRLDVGQISFNLVENAFATRQLALLAPSIAFYHILARACVETSIF